MQLDSSSWESNIYDILESLNQLNSFEMPEAVNINDLEINLRDIMHMSGPTNFPQNQS